MKIGILSFATALFLAPAYGEEAQRTETQSESAQEMKEMERKIDVLAQEIENMRAQDQIFVPASTGEHGHSPAASKIYKKDGGLSIGGYGEFLYENFRSRDESGAKSGKKDQFDTLRVIFYIGYKFTPKFVFNSEIEFEHASTGNAGSTSVEFAYLDYLYKPYLNFRGGLLLVPMGWVNELHEPPVFLGAERPETEQKIIPSTWRETGFGLFGKVENLSYKAFLVTGLDAVGGGSSNAEGFSSSGLRGGRQKGSKSVAQEFAGVIRVDYSGLPGTVVGTSVYFGDSGQDNFIGSQNVSVFTTILDGHIDTKFQGAQFRGLLAYANLSDVSDLNAARGLTGASSVGEKMFGYYLEGGYDVLHTQSTKQKLIPFVRWEKLDTQNSVPTGFTEDSSKEERIITFGASYKPIEQVVIKADYQFRSNNADTSVDQWNLALGYYF